MGKSDPLRKLTLVHLPAIVGALTQTIREQDSKIERLTDAATRGAVRALEGKMNKGRFEFAVQAALKGAFCEVSSIPARVQMLRQCCENLEDEVRQNKAVAEAVEKHRDLLTAEAAKLEGDANEGEFIGNTEAAATVRTIAAALREILAAPVKVETRKVWTAEYRVDRAAGNVKAGEFVAAKEPSLPERFPKGRSVEVVWDKSSNKGRVGIVCGSDNKYVFVRLDQSALAFLPEEIKLIEDAPAVDASEGPTS